MIIFSKTKEELEKFIRNILSGRIQSSYIEHVTKKIKPTTALRESEHVEEPLNEDLGNLIKIDEPLRKTFMPSRPTYVGGKRGDTTDLHDNLGRYSEINPIDKKVTTSGLMKMMAGKEDGLVGLYSFLMENNLCPFIMKKVKVTEEKRMILFLLLQDMTC